MSARGFRFLAIFVVTSFSQAVFGEYLRNEDVNSNYLNNSYNEVTQKSFSWLKGAQDMIASPAGHVAVQVAKELLNRSTGNSQVRSEVVLSLNVTNLLIILLLKVLIFSAGILGASHFYGGYGYGYNYARSLSNNEEAPSLGLSEGEDSLITGFLAAQGSGFDDCLYLAACANPDISYRYSRAARALLDGVKKFEGASLNNPRYNDLIGLVEKAAQNGFQGISCNTTSDCSHIL